MSEHFIEKRKKEHKKVQGPKTFFPKKKTKIVKKRKDEQKNNQPNDNMRKGQKSKEEKDTNIEKEK